MSAQSHVSAQRLIAFADYGGPYPGSFIPMLSASLDLGESLGLESEAVFSSVAEGREWLDALHASGYRVRVAPPVHGAGLDEFVREVHLEGSGSAILHTHFTAFDLAAARTAARERSAVVWHLHSHLGSGPKAFVRNAGKFAFYGRRVDAVLCAGPEIEAAARRRGLGSKASLLPNGIEVDRFSRTTDRGRSTTRAELGLKPDDLVVLHLGWDWKIKGGDLFLDAIAWARARNGRVVAISVGGGHEARRAVEAKGLGEAVKIVEALRDIAPPLWAVDCFVSTSIGEGTPFAMMEAMASGAPVVASDIPAHRSIDPGSPTFIRAPLNDREVGRSIVDIFALPEEARARGIQHGVQWISANRSLGAWKAALERVYTAIRV